MTKNEFQYSDNIVIISWAYIIFKYKVNFAFIERQGGKRENKEQMEFGLEEQNDIYGNTKKI